MSIFSSHPRRAAASVALVLAVTAAGCAERGQSGDGYPQRTIDIVVPYPAGSGIDTTTRALVDIVNETGELGARVQVVNREGGAGAVGTAAVLNAKADGYTLGVVPDGPLTLIPQTQDVPYDVENLTVLSEIVASPVMFVVPENSPYDDLDGLLAAAQASPSSLTIGEGPLNYRIPVDVVEEQADVSFKRVKFDGDQATTTALLGGNVDIGVMQLASALPQLESGKLRALAITSAEPVDLVPDVPTFDSAGIELEWLAYNVLIAPGGLDGEVVDAVTQAFGAAIKSDDFAQAAQQLGLIVSGAGPGEAKKHLDEKTDDAADVLGGGE